jgi:hypothetical protein
MITVRPVAGYEPGSGASGAEALIAEARRRQRRRWRRRAVLAVIAVLLAAAVAAGVRGLPGRVSRPAAAAPSPGPAQVAPMPSQVVAWTGAGSIEVLSSRTGRVVRTLAAGIALYRGLTTVAVSAAGVVYFDDAGGVGQGQVMSVPLAGGPVRAVAAGRGPAVSPDGRLLAYVTYTDMTGAPEAIVVRDLATRMQRSWAFTSSQRDIGTLSWSPGGGFLSFTVSTPQSAATSVYLLDTRSPGGLGSARRVRLRRGLQWAGFLTPDTGMAVAAQPGQAGRDDQQSLVEVAVSSGRVVRQLTLLPAQGLFTDNALDGPEAAITADPSGRYLLIAGAGPDGRGVIFRWAVGAHRLAAVTADAVRAAWA